MREVSPLAHRHVREVRVRRFRAPEVRRERLERESEYVPRARDVEERQEECELKLPSPVLAHSLRNRVLRLSFICLGFD
jgi:hypothetical protein